MHMIVDISVSYSCLLLVDVYLSPEASPFKAHHTAQPLKPEI